MRAEDLRLDVGVRAGAGKVVGQPVMAALAVLLDGRELLLSPKTCSSEGEDGWKAFSTDWPAG
ncbi:MAG: transposase, partial [Bacteroidales bacterium]|nr:transposase [Bacteroidales bacterium]